MKNLSSSEIRQMFLDFFKEKGHSVEPSASLIPKDDDSLLWINSGVATMKKYFDGSVVPKNPRLVNSQKSIRTNDIENVGVTPRHQTLFEMLGNFSVGDYFKQEVIPWAYELITSEKWFGWDKEKIYVTVYPEDLETKELWKKVGLSDDHIIEMKDNFWDIGQGPSGPDSEIFYDRGEEYNNVSDDDPENFPGGENERYLEVWNIVFSQFNHTPENTYVPLPRKNIDTGMGLERVVSVFQDAKTNFETDLFLPIIRETEKFTNGKKYGENAEQDVAFKVIADHIRTITFAIGDGALPSNEGRGYVIRRLLRRAFMNGHQLGINGTFLNKLVKIVGKIMKPQYPEVAEQEEYISKIVESEENRFNETLSEGLKLLNDVIDKTKENNQKLISGEDAFKLYDTYGFPLDLTEEYAEKSGIKVDEKEFDAEMQAQKQRARDARSDSKSMKVQRDLLLNLTDKSEYVGYTDLKVNDSKLIDIIYDEKLVDLAEANTVVEMIFEKTPFYAEMGGQVADTGFIYNVDKEKVAEVTDVQHAPNGQNLHTVKVIKDMKANEQYILEVDEIKHKYIEKNHTATHLLDQTLRNVLDDHTKQAGSLVQPNYLRFDFNYFGQLTDEDLLKIEQKVNDKIFASLNVETTITTPEKGKEMGAIALFDDKYGDEVRVVNAGNYSIEFCGGNHVKNTDEIGLFKIVSESGVGAGVRRIEAVTSKYAFEYLNKKESLLNSVFNKLKANNIEEIPQKIDSIQTDYKNLEKINESLEAKLTNAKSDDIFKQVSEINGFTVIKGVIKNTNMKQLRKLSDNWREQNLSQVLVLGTNDNGKANLLVAVSDDGINKGIKAGNLIKELSLAISGKGGGKPSLAQAGGDNPSGLNDAINNVNKYFENI
ncbi:alanine--tRNA ligase [Lactobacillus sp. S2-2]|uniref:alanine--tRNA ligase n=1 Tax=Lactobacillus sp. S2-2 TaxID=2692917 RepID=UPI001F000A62|nr:alanine--tRNA ligase [Lactobacillus sp. S2-2]MCF6515811.1 alanine--tRNA ligase [Lactobacillus sp. S2-2]